MGRHVSLAGASGTRLSLGGRLPPNCTGGSGNCEFQEAARTEAAGEGYVDADPGRSNGYENDWNDEGPIGYGNTTNVVGLWQWILWSDGYLPYVNSIDCVFGSGTQEATRKWNVDRSWDTLHSGRAETQSFANADNELRFGGDYNSTLQYVYYGDSARPVTFR